MQPPPNPLTNAADLFAEVLTYYRRTFRVVMPVALASTTSAYLLSFAFVPQNPIAVILWSLVVLTVSLATQAAVLWAVAEARKGSAVGLGRAVAAAIAFGPRYVALSFIMGAAVLILALSGFGLPVGIYLLVRWLVAGPALVEENRTVPEAFKRSWALVERRWWRTAGLGIVAIVGAAIPETVGTWVGNLIPSTLPAIAVYAVGSALSLSFLSAFQVLLFEDYRRASEGTPPGQQHLNGI